MESSYPLLESVSAFLSANPTVLLVQSLMISTTCVVIFLILFVLRDILLRTHSFLYQVFCVVLVAALPVIGFLLYLLIRPSRTIAERTLEHKIDEVLGRLASSQQKKQQNKKAER